MTEWDASEYARLSALQEAMAQEVLSLLDLKGTEHVWDVGCGNGKVTSKIAARVPQGSVVGVDSSADMIAFASKNFCSDVQANLRFEVANARNLPFREEFDLVVSFNALHWIAEQSEALGSIRDALKPDGLAQLRLVPTGPRESFEAWSRKPASHRVGLITSRNFMILSPPDARAIWSISGAQWPACESHSYGRQGVGLRVSLCIPGS
jgi:trans-aconitate 2-methyltransferase